MQFIDNAEFPRPVISSTRIKEKYAILSNQIDILLSKNAITKVIHSSFNILSRIFTVKKANGDDRLIIDLSKLNKQIIHVPFQMESHAKIVEILEKNDYMASIDLCDAFFSVPIHPDHKRYLAFEFDNTQYVYNVLPFGLTSSPRIFFKVLKPVIVYLRSQGIKISFYLDDIFLCASSSSSLKSHIYYCLKLLTFLGFNPNFEKSNLTPSKTLKHLGYEWNSADMTIAIPPDKLEKTRRAATKLLSHDPTLRELSSFLGRLVSHSTAFNHSALYYRNIQLQFCNALKSNIDWDTIISLNDDAISDITWWQSVPPSLPPRSLITPEFELTLHTDASTLGWGGYLSTGSYTSGIWTEEEKVFHINVLELQAVIYCVSSFIEELCNSSLKILSDNITTVYYINKIGGTHSAELCSLSIELWHILLKNNINCSAFHIKGTDNTLADHYSRSLVDRHDYFINHDTFSEILDLLPFTPSIDLFASSSTNKLPTYVSLHNDDSAFSIDAFSIDWSQNLYIFPPIPLITRVIQKIKLDHSDNIILLTPAWPGLMSIPVILSLLFSDPIFIPSSRLLGQTPTRYPFCLIAWPLSTRVEKTEAYQRKLASHCTQASLAPLWQHTRDTGANFVHMLQQKGHKVSCLCP